MGFLSRAFESRATVKVAGHPGGIDDWFVQFLGGGGTASGVAVSEESSLNYTAVLACVRVLAETVSSLPLHLYRRLERGKERAVDHPLYQLLHTQPNPEMDSFRYRELSMAYLALWGNAYSRIERSRTGRVGALWPLHPRDMRVERLSPERPLLYTWRGEQMLADKVLHIRWLSLDGVTGLRPIQLLREPVALGLAAQEYGARLFGNDARPGVILQHPGALKPTARQNLMESWLARHEGPSRSHRPAILEEGMTLKEVGFPPEDAQFLETRKLQVTEIARAFRIPPHMVGDLTLSTNNNIEHQGIEFVTYCIGPWAARWEQAISVQLLTEAERRTYFAEHLVDGLLRGDIEHRYAAYATARQWGWLSVNDIRERENANPVQGGDEYLRPLNMVDAAAPTPAPAAPAPAAPAPEPAPRRDSAMRAGGDNDDPAVRRRAIAVTYRPVIAEATGRIIRRERADVMRAAERLLRRRSLPEFDAWLDQFYADEHQGFIARNIGAAFATYAQLVAAQAAAEIDVAAGAMPEVDEFAAEYTRTFAMRHSISSQGQLREVAQQAEARGEDAVTALNERFDEWAQTRPERVARRETAQLGNATARLVWTLAGVTAFRWVAYGNTTCPYCLSLNGKVVGVQGAFALGDTSLQPDGAPGPLPIARDTRHPPLHAGCLTGDSLVLPRSEILAASKRWYDGKIVVIGIASGHKLSCTPNHPILTPQGWVAAGALDEGGHVICDGGRKWRGVVDRDGNDVPTRIQDVVEAFTRSPQVVARPVPLASEDFHGDGVGSEVAVVWTNSLLADDLDVALHQHSGEFEFAGRNVRNHSLSSPGSEAHFGESLFPAGSCPVCGRGLSLALGWSHAASAGFPGGTSPSRGDAAFQQNSANHMTADAKLLSQRQFGASAQVFINDAGRSGDARSAAAPGGRRGIAGFAGQATRVAQVYPNGLRTDTDLAREIREGATGPVFVDEIIKIERHAFNGHVYNLQTKRHWFAANSIITHNCDCGLVPELLARSAPLVAEQRRLALDAAITDMRERRDG